MTIRIEFGPSRSPSYLWAVRLCKKLPGYKQTVEEGITVHSVDLDDIDTFEHIQRCIGGWKNTAYYLNDHPVAVEILWEIYHKKHPTFGALFPIHTGDEMGQRRTDYVPETDIVDLPAEPSRQSHLLRLKGSPQNKENRE